MSFFASNKGLSLSLPLRAKLHDDGAAIVHKKVQTKPSLPPLSVCGLRSVAALSTCNTFAVDGGCAILVLRRWMDVVRRRCGGQRRRRSSLAVKLQSGGVRACVCSHETTISADWETRGEREGERALPPRSLHRSRIQPVTARSQPSSFALLHVFKRQKSALNVKMVGWLAPREERPRSPGRQCSGDAATKGDDMCSVRTLFACLNTFSISAHDLTDWLPSRPFS